MTHRQFLIALVEDKKKDVTKYNKGFNNCFQRGGGDKKIKHFETTSCQLWFTFVQLSGEYNF